ncbi:metallophosphoesterase [Simkania negevensis]|uniref:Metallophosphoesterase n=1 Tax=Simkania negevensis TaxID=83561 RepID=A0ABS3AS87_9BACT|nr:metallophosphoesterase [Simkania negevensis]
MAVWAIADLHLSFGTPNKEMDPFGEEWIGHADKVKKEWEASIDEEDLILLAGDLSWAMHITEAVADLEWLHALPGTKVIIRGNHDYWWESLKKLKQHLPPSIHPVHNTTFNWQGISIAGARLWDTEELRFGQHITLSANTISSMPQIDNKKAEEALTKQRKIFARELNRLELSLKELDPHATTRIAMTHYPPISYNLQPSQTADLLERYNIDICVFGHLHSVDKRAKIFGKRKGIEYHLTSCDYLNFQPLRILSR